LFWGALLTEIAKKAYRHAQQYVLILQANAALLNRDPNRIYVGQVLWIPPAPAAPNLQAVPSTV
jgi:nucleoid-associated protein YgaU